MTNDMEIESFNQTPNWECLSTTGSEASAAVVSLYQTWAGSSLSSRDSTEASFEAAPQPIQDHDDSLGCLESFTITTENTRVPTDSDSGSSISCDIVNGVLDMDDDITLWGFDDATPSNVEDDISCLRQNLSKRLRSEDDIPDVPVLKKRRKPVCHFLNYMGTRRVEPPSHDDTEPLDVEEENPWHLVGLGLEEFDSLFPVSVDLNDSSIGTPSRPCVVKTTKTVFAAGNDAEELICWT